MTTRRSTNVRRVFYVRSTIVVLVLGCASLALAQTSPGVVGEVRVHGNHTTPDADILGIVGDVVGKPATDQLVAEIHDKLERAAASTASRSASGFDRSRTPTTSC